jgi:hypothetical protein
MRDVELYRRLLGIEAPSVILFRHGSQHHPADQAALLKDNLPPLSQALDTGSMS